MRTQRIVRLLGLGMAVALAVSVASPANATKGGHHSHWLTKTDGYYQVPTPWKDSDSYDPECEGYDLTAHFWVHGVNSIKNIKGTDQAFFGANRFRFREVWKDNSTGEVMFTWWGKYKTAEYAAKRVRKSAVPEDLIPPEGLVGPIFVFKSYEKFRDVFKDAEGNRLFGSRALNLNKELFDTLGDHKPGGTSLSFETVKRFGHDALLDASPCDYLPAAS